MNVQNKWNTNSLFKFLLQHKESDETEDEKKTDDKNVLQTAL